MNAPGNRQRISEPDYQPSVAPDPNNADQNGQRIEVLAALLHGIGDGVKLQMSEGHEDEVPRPCPESLGELDVEGVLVDLLVYHLVDAARRDVLASLLRVSLTGHVVVAKHAGKGALRTLLGNVAVPAHGLIVPDRLILAPSAPEPTLNFFS